MPYPWYQTQKMAYGRGRFTPSPNTIVSKVRSRGIDGVWTEFFVLSEKIVKICDSGLFWRGNLGGKQYKNVLLITGNMNTWIIG